MNRRPWLSVVIAVSGEPDAALVAVERLRAAGELEILVVSRKPGCGRVGVRWVEASPDADVHRLRAEGLAHARGQIVAFCEDDGRVSEEWAEGWRRAFLDPRVRVATGPVERAAGASVIDWGVFFCEYAPFLASRGGGPIGQVSRIAGNNFAARREWLKSVLANDGVHEWALRRGLESSSEALRWVPQARVEYRGAFRLGPAIRERLELGRDFGRMRAESQPRMRWVAVALGPAIYGSQVVRLVATLVSKRRHLDRLIEALPITLALLLAWSVGEWLGWALGPDRPLSGRRGGTEDRRREQPGDRPRALRGGCRDDRAVA